MREDARVSDFLFQASVTTWQAYNYWPRDWYPNTDWRAGRSLYTGPPSEPASWGPEIPEGHVNGRQARAVSFNRPYAADNNSPYYTAGQFFIRGEYNMVRWMEKEGYDVTYTTDVDTDAATDITNGPLSPGRHKVFLSVGHDEYWSWQMRDNLEQARNRSSQPLNVGWFGANNSHWQVRFANSSPASGPGNEPRRTIITYKQLATSIESDWRDPVYSPGGSSTNYLTTGLWRDNRTFCVGCSQPAPAPYKAPEDELVGVMTNLDNPTGRGDFEFAGSCPDWVTENVDISTPFAALVGYEADQYYPLNIYPGRAETTVISDSDFPGKSISTQSHAVYYRMNAGARVFAAGTIEWGLGLDGFGGDVQWGPAIHVNYHDPRVGVTTANILVCLRDGGAACI